jgi:hypothetical protein
MAAMRSIRLGQEAFVLSREGDVVRTMVGSLKGKGKGYEFLNGDDSSHEHWFALDQALAAADKQLRSRQDRLRQQIRTLAAARRSLTKKGYEKAVRSAPYRVVDLRDPLGLAEWQRKKCRTRRRKKVIVPQSYARPGDFVYAIVTPLIKPYYEGASTYRPHNHFVLETVVESVCFAPDGNVFYKLSTTLVPEEFFTSRKEAEKRLDSYSEHGGEPIHFVSHAEEKTELDKMSEDDDIPF